MTPAAAPRANVVGLGVIGGSVALALRSRGWVVHGEDTDTAVVSRALGEGVIDAVGLAREATITIVAVPVDAIESEVQRALDSTDGIVTDVGSVKAQVCSAVDDRRFVGGHPMAGSELEGLDGADEAMFEGAVWVLTPRPDVADGTFSTVASLVADLGADVVALSADAHDRLVAVVSHVPHLLAASLMRLASTRSQEHASLLRLAAGGFRDMTRIASGHPRIWLDICAQNRAAILEALDELGASLSDLRDVVARGRRDELLEVLSEAREARANLPSRVTDPTTLAEFRIRIPDRAGAAAEVFTLAAELGVNIANFEVVHLAEGNRGLAVVLVDVAASEMFRGGLLARGFRPTVTALA
ncbi:MAG: prephenate dehydrogenase/arogenate dehydrogenase family protein [Ilumatobacteraceae bacterium]